jgi:3-hydroxymyristoyl/3-hydroxydecanoyl-(acyl carrier protein) dehydratase
VLAGTLIGEGCGQVLKFYMLFLGLQTCTKDAVFQPLPQRPQKVRCRGQVTPKDKLLTYRMEVKEIGIAPDPYVIADIDVLLGDKVVLAFTDIGGRMAPLIDKET